MRIYGEALNELRSEVVPTLCRRDGEKNVVLKIYHKLFKFRVIFRVILLGKINKNLKKYLLYRKYKRF